MCIRDSCLSRSILLVTLDSACHARFCLSRSILLVTLDSACHARFCLSRSILLVTLDSARRGDFTCPHEAELFCSMRKSRCASLLRSKACSIIPLKTIAYGNPRLVDYLHVTIWLQVTPLL